jgi:ADP-ribose pyrophosphatase
MADQSSDDRRVELVEKTTPYNGYFQVDRFTLKHRKFDGGWTPVLLRELFERGHTAVVLPYDPAADSVVLVEQFRIGAYAAGLEPWMTEAVAGTIEDGEDAAEVVRREAMEEAGCALSELASIGTFVMTPGGSSETTAMFCGRVDSQGLGGIHGLDHEGEDIRAVVLPLDEALKSVAEGGITSAYAVIPLLWLGANREDLRARWR